LYCITNVVDKTSNKPKKKYGFAHTKGIECDFESKNMTELIEDKIINKNMCFFKQ
jgi:hypothetical protein